MFKPKKRILEIVQPIVEGNATERKPHNFTFFLCDTSSVLGTYFSVVSKIVNRESKKYFVMVWKTYEISRNSKYYDISSFT